MVMSGSYLWCFQKDGYGFGLVPIPRMLQYEAKIVNCSVHTVNISGRISEA